MASEQNEIVACFKPVKYNWGLQIRTMFMAVISDPSYPFAHAHGGGGEHVPSTNPKKMKNAAARTTGRCLTYTICAATRSVVTNMTVEPANLCCVSGGYTPGKDGEGGGLTRMRSSGARGS